MNEFVVTGADMFGRYCLIEQKSYRFSPNEFYIYKVVSSLRSNCWCEVPYKAGTHEVLHDSIEDCVLAICCGVDETCVQRFRMADVELLPSATCDRDTPQKVAEEMFGDMRHSTKEEADAYEAMLKSKSVELHPVDRDALLALADEMEEFGNLPVKHPGIRVLHNDDFSRELGYARRIREALGVES